MLSMHRSHSCAEINLDQDISLNCSLLIEAPRKIIQSMDNYHQLNEESLNLNQKNLNPLFKLVPRVYFSKRC